MRSLFQKITIAISRIHLTTRVVVHAKKVKGNVSNFQYFKRKVKVTMIKFCGKSSRVLRALFLDYQDHSDDRQYYLDRLPATIYNHENSFMHSGCDVMKYLAVTTHAFGSNQCSRNVTLIFLYEFNLEIISIWNVQFIFRHNIIPFVTNLH